MPINTDLNISPYFDDYDSAKNFYKVLFKPGVAVQVRELNQLQTLLQTQVERFGDNIFKKGTIIDGCNFIFHNPLPYAKINDSELDGTPVIISQAKGRIAESEETGLKARVIEIGEGFQTSADQKTLFLKYLNTGNNNEYKFIPGETIKIYTAGDTIEDINLISGSAGFSNNDTVVITSAIQVNNQNGGSTFSNQFEVGETLTTDNGAQVEVIETLTRGLATYIRIKPLASQLKLGNTASWSINLNSNFICDTSGNSGKIINFVGAGAAARIATNKLGQVTTIVPVASGSGYEIQPHVSISFATADIDANEGLIDAFNAQAVTYLARYQVNEALDAIGDGYGFSVGPGILYQNGYFVETQGAFAVVERYSTSTDKVVGFATLERIVSYLEDTSLYDNATGTLNETAPGADRLALEAGLIVLTKDEAEANTEFFPIVEFSEGRPYKQNDRTVYNTIGDEIARRTYEESGNYTLDTFLVKTNSVEEFENDSKFFEVSVDPGKAYINGHRIETLTNFSTDIEKGIDTAEISMDVPLEYGNYFIVDELAGSFNFGVGDNIEIYDAPQNYLSNYNTSSTITPPVSGLLRRARIRSLQLVSGEAGTPGAKYRMYVWDMTPNINTDFPPPLKNARSIFFNGTTKGVCDIVLDSNGNAQLYGTDKNALLFYAGTDAIKSIKDLSYTYRTENNSGNIQLSQQGTIAINLSATGETFDYDGTTLTDVEKLSIIVSPQSTTTCSNVTTTATTVLNGANTQVTGILPSTVGIVEGDYVRIADAAAPWANVGRVIKVTSSTLDIATNLGHVSSGDIAVALCFPKDVPIPLYLRDNRSITLGSSNTSMTIDVGNTSIGTAQPVTIAYQAKTSGTSEIVSKTIVRKAYVKLNLDITRTSWDLGLTDVIRLRNVYKGDVTVSTADERVTNQFYIDHRQYKNSYGTARLRASKSFYGYAAGTYILVELDVLVHSGPGVKTINSYPINDSIPLKENTAAINTLEIPEVYSNQGEYFDLRDQLDFRPRQKNTAAITSDPAVNVTTDPDIASGTDIVFSDANTITSTSTDLSIFESGDLIRIVNGPNNGHTATVATSTATSLDVYGTPFVAASAGALIGINTLNNWINKYDRTTQKKFPLPGSTCSFTAERYLPRIDSLYMEETGDFKVIKGSPSINPVAKPIKDRGMLLNLINVAPYPSLPNSGLLKETIQYQRKRSYSGQHSMVNRQLNYVNSVSSESLRADKVQPKGYTMSQIGALERRIADLEYYTALSFTENEVNVLQIPGSDGTNRFKFGFFVDNFTTVNYFDVRNDQTIAQIHQFRLKPRKKQLKIKYKFNTRDSVTAELIDDNKLEFPYTNYRLIHQPYATESEFVRVRTKSVTTRTDTETIESERTIVTEVPRTEYYQTQEEYQKEIKYLKALSVARIPRAQTNDSAYSSLKVVAGPFTVGKLAGEIYILSVTKGQHCALQRKINGVWTDIARNGKVGQEYIKFVRPTSPADWWAAIRYPYEPEIVDGVYVNREFRFVLHSGRDGHCWTGDYGWYPRSEDAITYETATRTVTRERTVIDEVTEIIPDSEVVSEESINLVDNLFNSKRTSLTFLDNLFDRSSNLNHPFVNLAAYVYNDLDDNPNPKVYKDAYQSVDYLPDA